MNRFEIQLFRLHSLCAQLLFAATNPGVLQEGASSLATQVRQYAQALEMTVMEAKPESLVDQINRETEARLPDLLWIAALAQTATLRLLYLNTSIEETDVSEIMALELTTLAAAKRGGISEDRFMDWHRSMFADHAKPTQVVSELEALVVASPDRGQDSAGGSSQMIEPIDLKIPILPGFVSIDVKKAVKAVRVLHQKWRDA